MNAPALPRISVIIPTRNRSSLLRRALATVLGQSYPPDRFEIVIVADGCTDDTVQYLSTIEAQCRLCVIEQANQGPGGARNRGVAEATGEIVLFLDDDLICPPHLLRRHAEGHLDGSMCVVFGTIDTAPLSASTLATDLTRASSNAAAAALAAGISPPGRELLLDPNSSLPRSLLLRVGVFDASIGGGRETAEIALRLRAIGVEFRHIRDAVVEHVYVKTSMQLTYDDAFLAGRNEIAVRRKNPRFRFESPLADAADRGFVRRGLRRFIVACPGSDALVASLAWSCERFRRFGLARSIGIRLLTIRQGINFWRGAISAAGSSAALHAEFGVRLPVLMYHHVGSRRERTYPELSVSPERFARHLKWLARLGYEGISPSQWVDWCLGKGGLPKRPVLLTFDDAYSDTAKYAFPLMRDNALPGVVFVVADKIGGTNSWDEQLGSGTHRLMNLQEIRYWADHGIEVGAHGRTHADLTKLPAAQLRDEIVQGGDLLAAQACKQVVAFAYPYGSVDTKVEAEVRSRFEISFGTAEGINSLATNRYRLRRTMVLPDDNVIDLVSRLLLGYSLRRRFIRFLAYCRRALRKGKS